VVRVFRSSGSVLKTRAKWVWQPFWDCTCQLPWPQWDWLTPPDAWVVAPWTDLIAGHGFWVLICHPPICMSLSSCVVIAVCHWWCWGLRCHSSVVCGALFTICWQWCGVPHCGSRVVVVGIPCHEGGGWLGCRVLVAHGCSMMVMWWALSIVVVVSPVVESGGGGGGRWVLVGCCCLCAVLVVLGSCWLLWVGSHCCWWMMVVVDLVPHCGVLVSWTSSSLSSGKSLSTWHTQLNHMHATSADWWWHHVLGTTAVAVLRYRCHYRCRHCHCRCP